MKVVVTGGSGQLGTLVLERLVLTRKIKKIVCVDLVPPVVPSARIDWRIGDMRDPGLERHLEGADVLVHLAFIVARRASVETMRAVNVEGSKRIFDAAAQHQVGRIVHVSSVAAYGVGVRHPSPIVETTPRRGSPTLVYADNKYEVEEYLDAFETAHPDVAVVRVRPGILFGRRIAHVSPRFLRRRVMPVVSEARGPIVWDEDVADGVVLAVTGTARGAFNLVASEPLSGQELARLAGFQARKVPKKVVDAAARATGALAPLLGEHRVDLGWIQAGEHDMIVDGRKAREVLGWKPRYPTSADVAIAFGKNVRAEPDPRIRLFLGMVPRLARRARSRGEMPQEALNVKITVHVDVTGPRGDDFGLSLSEGVLGLKRGIPRPVDATITLASETFLELLSGHLDTATATMIGKIRVRGEPFAGLLFGGIVSGFRRSTTVAGVQGRIARGLSTWFERGAPRA